MTEIFCKSLQMEHTGYVDIRKNISFMIIADTPMSLHQQMKLITAFSTDLMMKQQLSCLSNYKKLIFKSLNWIKPNQVIEKSICILIFSRQVIEMFLAYLHCIKWIEDHVNRKNKQFSIFSLDHTHTCDWCYAIKNKQISHLMQFYVSR